MATEASKSAAVSDDSVESSRVDLADVANSLLTVLAKLYVSGRHDDVERRAAGELAHAAGVTLSVTVSRLTRRGLICRPSPTPDRRNCLALTGYGAWVVDMATQARHQRLQTRTLRLSREDQHALSDAAEVLRRWPRRDRW